MGVAVVAGQHLASGLVGGEVAGAAVVQEEPLQDQVEADRLGGGQRWRDERRQQGLGGRLYWFAVLPFHGVIFNGMANRITATATDLADAGEERSPGGRGAQR